MAPGRGTLAAWWLVALSVALPATPAAGDQALDAHVRGLDANARQLIADARTASPTVARLMDTLDRSDVIVLTSLVMKADPPGDTHFLSVTRSCRILLVRIERMTAPWDQIAYLGHELQHAVEVSAAPEVRSASGLQALMMRIGRGHPAGLMFETDGAIQITQRVRQEMVAARVR